MQNISDVVGNQKCTGCSACLNICPVGAITMFPNEEGFLCPDIDSFKCINCGLCSKVCPIINKTGKGNQYPIPTVYAGWNKNEKVRMKSSSGGVFSALAEYFLRKKGYICGVAIDTENKLNHTLVSSRKDLEKLRNSKYTQSNVGEVFKNIKQLLEADKWVLFTGTPCQASGLRNYLNKDYKKLLIVEIICHGVPSPSILNKYIENIEKEKGMKIRKINFKDKSTGWETYSFTMYCNRKQVFKEKFTENTFFDGFLNNLYLNKICTSCPFSNFPRIADITLGDYWGIGELDSDLNSPKGVSMVIVNNKQGDQLLSSIREDLFLKKIKKKDFLAKLKSLNIPSNIHPNREDFFNRMKENPENLSKNIKESLTKNIVHNGRNIAILNMRFPTNNFGAILQSFALYNVLKDLGYRVKVINYISKELDQERDKISLLNLDQFRENNISYTLQCYSDEDLSFLNRDFDTFIVGSDQVWNYNYIKWAFPENVGKYFLNFVLPTKKTISYAASFAENSWGGTKEEIGEVKKALKKFSAVSVREKSGVNICKELFGISAEHVLDPTLLLNSDKYEDTIQSEVIERNEKRYIAYFTLDSKLEEAIEKNPDIQSYVKKSELTIKNIRGEEVKVLGETKFIYNSVPAWLNYIKNAELVITDSYHGVIFSIIFKKPFVCIERGYAGNERLNSLFSTLKIKNRFFKTIGEIDFETLMKRSLDYKNIYAILQDERKKSFRFLENSLKLKNDKNSKIALLEGELLERESLISSLREQKEGLESKLQEMEKELEVLNNQLVSLNKTIFSLENSKSWRITKPVRDITKFIKNMEAKLKK